MCAARSPSRASGSRPPKGRARSSTPSTRRSGGPSGASGSPVSAIAPLAAQRSTRGSSIRGRVTSRDSRTPERRCAPGRAAQRCFARAQCPRAGPARRAARPTAARGGRSPGQLAVRRRGRDPGTRRPGLARAVRRRTRRRRPGPRSGRGEPGRSTHCRGHPGAPAARRRRRVRSQTDWWPSRPPTRCSSRARSSQPGAPPIRRDRIETRGRACGSKAVATPS